MELVVKESTKIGKKGSLYHMRSEFWKRWIRKRWWRTSGAKCWDSRRRRHGSEISKKNRRWGLSLEDSRKLPEQHNLFKKRWETDFQRAEKNIANDVTNFHNTVEGDPPLMRETSPAAARKSWTITETSARWYIPLFLKCSEIALLSTISQHGRVVYLIASSR